MCTIKLLNKKHNKVMECDVYAGNIPQCIFVGPVDGEHKGYDSIEELAKDWEIFKSTPPKSLPFSMLTKEAND